MVSKALLRSAIEDKKDNYFKSDISYCLVEAAIYTGIYKAIGGTKVIALPVKLNNIAKTSELFFKFLLKLKDTNDDEEAVSMFNKLLSKYNKTNVYNIKITSDMSDSDLASLFTSMVFDDYTEDIVVNRGNIYGTIYDLLESKFSIFKKKEL